MEHDPTQRRREVRLDAAIAALVAAVSLAVHLGSLGFYSDDWDLLGSFALAPDQSLPGFYRTMYAEPQVRMRPGQVLYLSLLYRVFGTTPLGYHLANAVVLIAAAALLVLVLRDLGVPRAIAVSAGVLYPVLPHYSTARVWYSAFQAPLSMVAYLFSLYAALRSLHSAAWRTWAWRIASLAALVASALAYEVALPLFFLNPLLVWARQRRLASRAAAPPSQRGLLLFLAATVAAALSVAAFKALTSTRLSHASKPGYLASLIHQISHINAAVYGIAAPRTLWIALHNSAEPASIALAAGLGILVAGYLYRVLAREPLPSLRQSVQLAIAGAAVVLLGHVVFITTRVSFSPTGPNNRTAVAAAAGVALGWSAAAALAAVLLPRRWRAPTFAGVVGAGVCGAFLVTMSLEKFWVIAYEQERQLLAGIRQSFPTLPRETTLLLDGFCPYVGPAIVFEAPWDLKGALWVVYQDSTLRADVVSPNLRVEPDGIVTRIYGEDSKYPYRGLVVFNARTRSTYPIADAAGARAYFAEHNPDLSNGCPPGRPGHGVQVF
jgi:hypothetical protein